MKHARKDYNRIQDPNKKIPEDMPVFLLLAKDHFAARTVEYYARQILADPRSSLETVDVGRRVLSWARQMEEYGRKKGTKYPDMPEDV